MSTTIDALVEALEAAKNMLGWYKGSQPDAFSTADEKLGAQIDAALLLAYGDSPPILTPEGQAKADADSSAAIERAALARAEQAEPVECTCTAKDMPFGRCCKATNPANAEPVAEILVGGNGMIVDAVRRPSNLAPGFHKVYTSPPAPVQAVEPLTAWQPQFEAISHKQETLVREFCAEIAGPFGGVGNPPDPVRLLEMAQALYEAERDDLAAAPPLPKG